MSFIEDSEFPILPPEVRRSRHPHRSGRSGQPAVSDMAWNVMTMLVWLMTAFIVMAFLSIFSNPYSPLNPLQPGGAPTLAAMVVIPTATLPLDQPTVLAPLAITTTPLAPTELPTLTPTATPQPTETATPGPSPTATIHSLYPFIQRGELKAIDGATFHTSDECRLWVAGQAYDLQNAPLVGVTVMLGGSLEYKYISQLSLTGTALQYGQAGYEFTIAETPVKSKDAVWVQLFDQSMVPLSERVLFETYDNCSQNLILVNFRQVR